MYLCRETTERILPDRRSSSIERRWGSNTFSPTRQIRLREYITQPYGNSTVSSQNENTVALIACGVLEWNFQRIVSRLTDRHVIVRYFPAQLHNNPVKLRELLQEAIDDLSSQDIVAIAIGYGLCGRGTVGLKARTKPLILPRVQDCIGAMLGSHTRHLQQFSQNPGTRYLSQGWYDKTVRQKPAETHHTDRNQSLYGPTFQQLSSQYGEENARFICEFRESWKKNYQRAAYIHFEGEPDCPLGMSATESLARDLGWEHEVLDGDESLLEAMLSGKWRDPRILVVPAGCSTVAAPGDTVLDYVRDGGNSLDDLHSRYETGSRNDQAPVRTGIGLGIDTGGTYTDAVLYDFDHRRVLASAKAPTTHGNLALGIRQALEALPHDQLVHAGRVGLSTTLATNAFVENKGRAVGLLVMCPYAIGNEHLPFRYVHHIRGTMNMQGQETEAIDQEEVRRCARKAKETGCEAVAVSGFASVVNPTHELAVSRLVFEETGLHTVCGHELTTRLNFIERATTAAMNARLIPLVESLIDAVQNVLADLGLGKARLMVVKGDGSQVLADVARQCPVETVLSGPAASVVGAATLFGSRDAMVADLGGTTLDVARLHGGTAVISDTGARIGGFRTSVRAMAVHTIGLGGDSEIDLSHWPEVSIGPRRVIPLCRLSEVCPDFLPETLEEQFREAIGPVANCLDIVTVSNTNPRVPPRILQHLQDGPLVLGVLARRMNRAFPAHIDWHELETSGQILRFGLTLTDILHLEGRFLRFDVRPPEICLKYWSALHETPVAELIAGIHHQFRATFSEALISAVLPNPGPWHDRDALRTWLVKHIAEDEQSAAMRLFNVRLPAPVIGVGAPAAALMPQLKASVGQDILLSEFAGVANAIGAIAGDVLVHETATIRMPDDGSLVCSWRGGTCRATDMNEALTACEQALDALMRREAAANDVPYSPPCFSASVQRGKTRDGPVVLGVAVTAELKG